MDGTSAESTDPLLFEKARASQAGVRVVPGSLLRGLSVEGRWVDVDGTATFLLEGGRGPTIVLLHGGIPTGGVYWARMISRLENTRRVIVPDVPGQGISEPLANLDASTFADWLTELLRLTCREEPILIAHSLVASLAARFAIHGGHLIRGLVLTGVPALGRWRPPPAFAVAAIRSSLRPSSRNTERFARWAFHDLDRTRQTDREWFDAFLAYLRARGADPGVKRATRQLVRTATKRIPIDELRRIAVPTSLVWGRHDRMVTLRFAEAASAAIGWPLHVIDDGGHVPFVEQPDAFLDALAAVEKTLLRQPTHDPKEER
jgi:2-hydroxymuconate-semialdehyde hydrolase